MDVTRSYAGVQLPVSFEAQLHAFRRRLWIIKSIEAAAGATFGFVSAYLCVFALDRFWDTPAPWRMAILAIVVCIGAVVPLYLHRWIWRQRHFEQLARLISRRHPLIGDQMLGIIELAHSASEQARSRTLCEAAIAQVAKAAATRDFTDSVPRPRHRLFSSLAAVPVAAAVVALALVPAAAENAWWRFLAPWQRVSRYTFTWVSQLPERLVVAHGEPIQISVKLAKDSPWRPALGTGQLGVQPPVSAELRDGRYEFALPPQIEAGMFALQVGDARQTIQIEPMLRPELTTMTAEVTLPAYLERRKPVSRDVRGGSVSLLTGSRVTFAVTANRPLAKGFVDGQKTRPAGAVLASQPLQVEESRKVEFRWQDEFGLAGLQPFSVSITARDDEPPSVVGEGLPRQKVVLDSELLRFQLRAADDFGVRRVGLEWRPAETLPEVKPARGEQLLAAGSSEQETLEVAGTFCAKSLGIEPQPVELRLFVEDYYPGRERVYSPACVLYVLSPEQHFVWLTEQLNKWHRLSLEVRDREMQLHQTNQQLRLLAPEELEQAATRRRIEAQAAAEAANGRRLSTLTAGGEELVRQAMRNPEFGVGHLEKWAEMLQILKDISANRMPNVADLLKQSSQAPPAVASTQPPAPEAGQRRNAPGGGPSGEKKTEPAEAKPPVPKLADAESSQQPASKDGDEQPPAEKKTSPGRLSLPVTTVVDAKAKADGKPPSPAGAKLDDAVRAQQDLLAEFEKIADELNKVLANLEGSTLTKRLKAASRQQYAIAGQIGQHVGSVFGRTKKLDKTESDALAGLAKQEQESSRTVSTIMDDLQSYFDRRRLQRFKAVLDEMRSEDAVGSLRQLGDDLPGETGMSIAQCEFWSDALDRWADDLVDPACSGKCPGCKSKGSLPPSIVLEALQILEAEVNLREQTRGAEQARSGLQPPEHLARAQQLAATQSGLSDRVAALNQRIRDLPDALEEFGYEIQLLARVETVMDDAAVILTRPETGGPAIAAETEAIELLLRSKKINPRGGGGGGASPGGGGGGTTNEPALALLGAGLNEKEVREDHGVSQATGGAGAALPEEFRAGLDAYFNRLEQERARP